MRRVAYALVVGGMLGLVAAHLEPAFSRVSVHLTRDGCIVGECRYEHSFRWRTVSCGASRRLLCGEQRPLRNGAQMSCVCPVGVEVDGIAVSCDDSVVLASGDRVGVYCRDE